MWVWVFEFVGLYLREVVCAWIQPVQGKVYCFLCKHACGRIFRCACVDGTCVPVCICKRFFPFISKIIISD